MKTGRMDTDAPTMRSLFHYTSDNEIVHEHSHDVSGILRANQFLRSEQTIHHEGEVFNHVANIDLIAVKNWCAQRGIVKNWWAEFCRDDKLLTHFLNDPDNKLWRTRLGKI